MNASGETAALDLGALEAITDAVEAGRRAARGRARGGARARRLAGPDRPLERGARGRGALVRRRARADGRRARRRRRTSCASATRSSAGCALRGRSGEPPPALLRLVTTLIASEVERVRAPERASEAAQEAFLRAVLHREVTDRGDIVARAAELGVDLDGRRGGDRRARAPLRARRGRLARARARRRRARRARGGAGLDRRDRRRRQRHRRPGARARAGGGRRRVARRAAEAVARELHAALHGFTFAVGYSRVAHDPVDLYRAGNEALLAANVAEARPARRGRRRRAPGGARVRGDRRLPAAAAGDERGPGRAPALLRRDGRAARRLRRAVRDRPRADARDVPRLRRQRRQHRAAPVHAPPHDPLPARARARPLRARRRLDRRAREARPRAEGDARARHRRAARARRPSAAPAAAACRAAATQER